MEDVVARVLDNFPDANFQTTSVDKALQLDCDLGHLLASDPNQLDSKLFRENTEDYLKNLARDNAQILINEIWKLPVERYEDVIIAKLPPPTTRLPREKTIPKVKPLTKWDEYAKVKGITKTSRSKLVWDEEEKKWKPRWGYNRVDDEKKDWMLEVPDNADPMEDQFAKRKKEKDERVAKNEFHRLRNIAKAKKIPIARLGIAPTDNKPKEQLNKARNVARVATASVGKFTQKLPKEKIDKKLGKKRKFDSLTGDMKTEKDRELGIVERLNNKKPKIDGEKLTKAVPLRRKAKRQNQKENRKESGQKKGTQKQRSRKRTQPARNKKGRKK